MWSKSSELHSFGDGNASTCSLETTKTLEKSEEGICWFQSYKMTVNPGKFQTINRQKTHKKVQSKTLIEIVRDGKHIKSDDGITNCTRYRN